MPLYLISGILMTIGGALMYTVKSTTPAANIYGYSILIAVGSGLTIQAGYSIATVKVAHKGNTSETQNAVSLQNISQLGSTLICLVISGQVFQSSAFTGLSRVLSGSSFSQAEIRGAVVGTQSTLFQHLHGDVRNRAIGAITQAMDEVYVLSLTAGAVMVAISPFMKRERIFGMEMSPGA
jgi:hypothetical protein